MLLMVVAVAIGPVGAFTYIKRGEIAEFLGMAADPLAVGHRWEADSESRSELQKLLHLFVSNESVEEDPRTPSVSLSLISDNPFTLAFEGDAETDVVALPDELERLLPPHDDGPWAGLMAYYDLQVAAASADEWIPLAPFGDNEGDALVVSAGERGRFTFHLSWLPEQLADESQQLFHQPPQQVRIRLAARTATHSKAEPWRTEQMFDVPDELQQRWQTFQDSIEKYEDAMQRGQGAMQAGNYNQAHAQFNAAQQILEVFKHEPAIAGLQDKLQVQQQQVEDALEEGERLAEFDEELKRLEEQIQDASERLAQARNALEEDDHEQARDRLREFEEDRQVSLPSPPAAPRHPEKVQELVERVDQARLQLEALNDETIKLGREIGRQGYAVHLAKAEDAFAQFDYAEAYIQAAWALYWYEDGSEASDIFHNAAAALRNGQRCHFHVTDQSAVKVEQLGFLEQSGAGTPQLVVVGANGTTSIWNLSEKAPTKAHTIRHGTIGAPVVISPDSQKLAAVSENLKVWDLTQPNRQPREMGVSAEISRSLCFDWKKQTVYIGQDIGRIHAHSLTGAGMHPIFALPQQARQSITAIRISPNRRTMVFGTSQGATAMFDLPETGLVNEPRRSGRAHSAAVTTIVFAPEGQAFVTRCGQRLIVWNAHGEDQATIPAGAIESFVFSPDGNTLYTGDTAGQVQLRPVPRPNEPQATMSAADASPITALAVSRNQPNLLAVGSHTGTVLLWDLQQRKSEGDLRVVRRDAGIPVEHWAPDEGRPAPQEAPQGPRPVPRSPAEIPRGVFRAVFDDVPEGNLPDGWEGDPTIGARKSGGLSWLQSAADGTHSVETPPLHFPGDFELEVWLRMTSGNLTMTLQGAGDAPNLTIDLQQRWRGEWNVTLGDAASQRAAIGYQPVRVRLVRQQDTFRVIIQEHVVVTNRLPNHRDFEGLRFLMDGSAGAIRIYEVLFMPHTDNRPRPPRGHIVEDFEGVPVGNLPPNWGGWGTVGVARERGSWVQASADGTHTFSTPDVNLSGDFDLECDVSFDNSASRSRLYITLEGQGNSPDLMVSFEYSWSGGSRVSLTDATAQNAGRVGRDGQLVRVRLLRDGSTFRLYVGDRNEALIAQRYDVNYDFRRITFRIQGGRSTMSRLHRLELQPNAAR